MRVKLIIDEDENKTWQNESGQLHREDGPAAEWRDGTRFWYLNGKPHRIDGPAAEWSSGHEEWWIDNNVFHTKEKWFAALTLEQKYNYIWKS